MCRESSTAAQGQDKDRPRLGKGRASVTFFLSMRWWNVRDASPSGLKLNRAWHTRQFLFALIPPFAAWVMLSSLDRWDQKHQLSKKLAELQSKAAEAKQGHSSSPAQQQQQSELDTLRVKVDSLEKQVSALRIGAAPSTADAPSSVSAPQAAAPAVAVTEAVEPQEHRSQMSPMKLRRAEQASKRA